MKRFLSENKTFKYAYINPFNSLFTYFPYMNYASFQIAADMKIYPALKKYQSQNSKYYD